MICAVNPCQVTVRFKLIPRGVRDDVSCHQCCSLGPVQPVPLRGLEAANGAPERNTSKTEFSPETPTPVGEQHIRLQI